MDEEERRQLAIARCFLGQPTWPAAVPPASTAEPTRVTTGQPIRVPGMQITITDQGRYQVLAPDGHVIIECTTCKAAHDFINNPIELGFGKGFR